MASEGTVPVRWSKEPEKTAWMLEHAGGRPIDDVRRDFEESFGHPLTKQQVSLFRAEYGLQRRRGNRSAHRRNHAPVGSERVCKGYVMVKVRELPDRPQSKDNWRFKHVLVWERTRGLTLPQGWMVLFCDHNARNFDPMNLKAVPRTLIGVMNGGPRWHDRETCEEAIALAMLKHGIGEAERSPRRCGVCGRMFVPDIKTSTKVGCVQRTCRECLDMGLRAPKDYGHGTCPECGADFRRNSSAQVYCSKECRKRTNARRRKEP